MVWRILTDHISAPDPSMDCAALGSGRVEYGLHAGAVDSGLAAASGRVSLRQVVGG